MDEDQIEIKNELIDEHEELQIKDKPNNQGFILSAIENTELNSFDGTIKKSVLIPKRFVKSETVTIQSYSNNKEEVNFPNNKVQEKCEVTSQKLIKTFLKNDENRIEFSVGKQN